MDNSVIQDIKEGLQKVWPIGAWILMTVMAAILFDFPGFMSMMATGMFLGVAWAVGVDIREEREEAERRKKP